MSPPDPRAQRWLLLAEKIRVELGEIGRLAREIEAARAAACGRGLSTVESAGMGKLLHDAYNGIERIFLAIAPELNGGLPKGEHWHRTLIEEMATDLPGARPAVISGTTREALRPFLRWRHRFRHIYVWNLAPGEVEDLLPDLASVLDALREDLDRFGEFLGVLAAAAGP